LASGSELELKSKWTNAQMNGQRKALVHKGNEVEVSVKVQILLSLNFFYNWLGRL
jgi:hypothetical protein